MARTKQKHNPNAEPVIITEDFFDVYDSMEFNLADGQTDYNVGANVSGAFDKVKYAHAVIIRTNKTISVKFNANTNSAVTVSVAEGSLTISRNLGLEISNIFITNASGATAAIKILILP
jgi:hypothetical protein